MTKKVSDTSHEVTNNMQPNGESAHLAIEGRKTGHRCSSRHGQGGREERRETTKKISRYYKDYTRVDSTAANKCPCDEARGLL